MADKDKDDLKEFFRELNENFIPASVALQKRYGNSKHQALLNAFEFGRSLTRLKLFKSFEDLRDTIEEFIPGMSERTIYRYLQLAKFLNEHPKLLKRTDLSVTIVQRMATSGLVIDDVERMLKDFPDFSNVSVKQFDAYINGILDAQRKANIALLDSINLHSTCDFDATHTGSSVQQDVMPPTKTFYAAAGRKYGYVHAWHMPGGKWFIEHGNSSSLHETFADDADDLSRWLDCPDLTGLPALVHQANVTGIVQPASPMDAGPFYIVCTRHWQDGTLISAVLDIHHNVGDEPRKFDTHHDASMCLSSGLDSKCFEHPFATHTSYTIVTAD